MAMSKTFYKHFRYDESVMQSKTVNNIVEALAFGARNPNRMENVVDFILKKHKEAMTKFNKKKTKSSLLIQIELDKDKKNKLRKL